MTSAARVGLPSSPYRGLMPFGDSELDALFFFGRERETELITANLIAAKLTVLYGASGVGKSSILRAGVARALRALPEEPLVIVFDNWTGSVDAAFAAATEGAEAGRDVYLVLDQLEEALLYDRRTDDFASRIGELVTRRELRIRVGLGIRDDALAQLDALKSHVPSLFGNYLRLDHLDREAGRMAITGPIDRWNELADEDRRVEIEAELVDALLDEITTGRVDLGGAGRGRVSEVSHSAHIETPYLQLVMQRLWDAERASGGNRLRLSTLRDFGGASSIVRAHLEGALSALTTDQKNSAARMFDHLVTPSGTKIAHGVGDLAQFAGASREELAPVLRTLAESRILRPVAGEMAASGGAFEIFHDVLADAVLEWRTRFEAQRDAARAHEESERRRRRAVIAASLALVALAIVAGIAILALLERRTAQTESLHARAHELSAQALLLQRDDPRGALSLATKAARMDTTSQTDEVLRSSLVADRLRGSVAVGAPVLSLAYAPAGGAVAAGTAGGRLVLWHPGGHDRRSFRLAGPVTVVAYDRPGRRLLAVGGGQVTIRNARTGRQTARISARGVADAAFLGDGKLIVTAGRDGLLLWRAATGRRIRRLPGSRFDTGVAVAADGHTVAAIAGGINGRVTPWLYDTQGVRKPKQLRQRGAKAIGFSPDGRLLASGSADGTTVIWDAHTGARIELLADEGKTVRDLSFSPDSSFLATASSDGAVRVWRIHGGDRFFFLAGHSSPVTRVAFAPRGASLVSTSEDRTARIWPIRGFDAGRTVALLAGSTAAVTAAAYAPVGRRVVTAGDDGRLRVWDASIDQHLRRVFAEGSAVEHVAFANAASIIVVGRGTARTRAGGRVVGSFRLSGDVVALGHGGLVASAGGRVITVQVAPAGRAIASLHAGGAVAALGFRADGKQLAVVTRDGAIEVWNVSTQRRLHRFRGGRGATVVALAPDGSVVATGGAGNVGRLWSADGRLMHVLEGHPEPMTDARFDPSGEQLVTTSEGSKLNAIVWSVSSGTIEHVLIGHFGTVAAGSFSPDGQWIVTAGPSSAGVWRVATGTLLFLLRGPAAGLTDAEWAPAGYRVVTSEADGTVRTYRCAVCLPADELLQLARGRLAAP